MKHLKIFEGDKGFYHLVTLLICLGIIVAVSVVLLICYITQASAQDKTNRLVASADEYNEIYFSDRILKGVTVSGYDIGGMTKTEAREYLAGCVDYDISVSELIMKYGEKQWIIDRDKFLLAVDVDYAVERAWEIGRVGTTQERTEALNTLNSGQTIDISATVVSDPSFIMAELEAIKEEIDIKKKNATVSFHYDNGPKYSYTDEVVGSSLDVDKAYEEICQLIQQNQATIEYELKPDPVQPEIRRSDLEKEYQLVASYRTYISSTNNGRRKNITIALECFNERVWMPGETLSFNQWVGERTAEKGFADGVYINDQQLYDETMGGGICQVSTTIYYCALLCGANMVGRNAPIEITERRPHSWPSVYIPAGLDATVSWPHTDLKLYNNNQTPYFIRTYMSATYVNVEIYGMPLPNDAKVTIETETIETIPPGDPEYIEDTKNEHNLAPGQTKLAQEARTGYSINVYQIWSEPGKEPIKTLLMVSKYNAIPAKYYIGVSPAAS